MSDLLASLKADLTSRRMLPLLAVALVALVGALAYVALAGKAGNSTPVLAPASGQQVATPPGPDVASAPANPNAAVSETTAGTSYQHHGRMRNPFKPLQSSNTGESQNGTSSGGSSSTTSGSSTSGGATSGSGGGASSGSGGGTPPGESSPSSGSGGSAPSGKSHPGPASEPVSLYHVDVRLQLLTETGQPRGAPQVFHDVASMRPLPSKSKALVEPVMVTGEGQGVAFVLISPAILHGGATCVPSAGDCEAIDLKLNKPEELQYEQEDGSVIAYRLTVTRIQKVTAGDASAASLRPSLAGSRLIAKMHLSIPSSAAFGGSLGTIVGATTSSDAHAARRSERSGG